MKKDSFNFVKSGQNCTAYGEYFYPLADSTTDTTIPSYFEITKVIWHKEWGGNVIDIDITDILGEEIMEIQTKYLNK
jgi:hypothetical protein